MTTKTTRVAHTPAWLPYPLANGAAITRRMLQHPTALITIGELFRTDKSKQDVAGPWWNRLAIRYLVARLRPGDRVFEWGSGGSTVWLIAQGAKVTSIEHNEEWVAKVTARCPEADVRAVPGVATGTIVEPEWSRDEDHRFFDDYVGAIDEFEDGSFAVVIVDGLVREECLLRATRKVKPGGLMILDDSDMRRFRKLKKSLPGWKTVSMAGWKASGDLRETTFFHKPA